LQYSQAFSQRLQFAPGFYPALIFKITDSVLLSASVIDLEASIAAHAYP
jgi:hypothetical protein